MQIRSASKFFVLLAAAVLASCAGPLSPTPSAGAPAGGSFPLGRVAGNSITAPLPTDAPAVVKSLAPLPSCGAEILFEQDVDMSPIPTAPGPTTAATTNQQGLDCLTAAWENGLKAEFDVSSISDEADEVYSMYRLPGDGTVQMIVRVRSHSDQTVSWTQTTCRQLSVQDGAVTPAACESETPIG